MFMSEILGRVSIKQKLWAIAALAGVIFIVMATILQLQQARDLSDQAQIDAEVVDDFTGMAQNWDAATRDSFYYLNEAETGQLKDTSTYDGVIDDHDDATALA